MRSLRLGFAPLVGLALVAACSGQDTGLLDLTLNADATNPPLQAVAVDLIGSGGIHRSYPGKFPPDSAASLRLEFPDLPTGTITFTVQTLDSRGCILGESPAPFAVAIKAGAKAIAATTIQRSTKPCGDGGGQAPGFDAGADTGADAGRGSEAGDFDAAVGPIDSPVEAVITVDAAIVVDTGAAAPLADAPTLDARSVGVPSPDGPTGLPWLDGSPIVDAQSDSLEVADAPASSPDVATVPTIVSFTASPTTISAGSSATLTAIFKNVTGSSIDHGIGSVSSGNGVGTGALTTTTTYRLTVTDASGASVSQQVTVTVVALPSITGFAALLPTIAVGTLTQLTGTFTGGTGSIDQGIGAVTSGTGVPTGVLTANTTFTLTVTNAAGDALTKQVAVTASSAVGTGVFTATGSMTVPRSNHTATLLPNGKVLITGGSTDTRAELYDPSTGTFSVTGSMHIWRTTHSATLLLNGKVLIVGGASDTSVEVYDPASGNFSLTGSTSESRAYHTATLLPDGKVLVAGGSGASSGYLASAELYTPDKGTFASTGQMSNPRSYATANLLASGQILVAWWLNFTNSPPRGYVATADLWDPSTGLFTPTGSLFYGRCSHTSASLLNGNVLIVGGEADAGPTLYSELYDPSTKAFSVSGSLAEERYRHTTTRLSDGSVLVAGGIASSGSPDPALSSAEKYDPGSGKFVSVNAMTTYRELHTATLLPNGSVLLTGSLPNIASAELYW